MQVAGHCSSFTLASFFIYKIVLKTCCFQAILFKRHIAGNFKKYLFLFERFLYNNYIYLDFS